MLGFIIVWFLIGFVSVLWGLRGKCADILFEDNEDVILGIALGAMTLGVVIINKLSEIEIRDTLYKLVNKKVDENEN